MRKITLAGREVCAMGLGCMSFGGIYGATDEIESFECLQAALDLGVDHWDVAEVYGMGLSETILGRFLKASGADVSIATKAGIYPKPERHFSNAPERTATPHRGRHGNTGGLCRRRPDWRNRP